jgi:hypothetical protein
MQKKTEFHAPVYDRSIIHWLKLRFFDNNSSSHAPLAKLEQEFQLNYRDKYAPGAQKAVLIGTIMLLVWIVTDVANLLVTTDSVKISYYQIVIGVRAGTCLIGVALYMFSHFFFSQFHRNMHWMTATYMFIAGATQVAFGALWRDTLNASTSVFIVLLYSMTANFARLPFRVAASVNTAIFTEWIIVTGNSHNHMIKQSY